MSQPSKIRKLEMEFASGDQNSIYQAFLEIERRQGEKLMKVDYKPQVSHVYNPLEYAREPHEDYIRKYCRGRKDVIFLGMNPGPFGMAQTGVPFGEVTCVRDWLKVEGAVGKPPQEHPKRIINGFSCTKREVSGYRFWSFFKETCGTPETFFKHCFVHNYCPLIYMTESSKNVTPPELKGPAKTAVTEICDEAFVDVMKLLKPKIVIGVGKFVKNRITKVLKGGDTKVSAIMHPSPVNPLANKGWKDIVTKELTEIGILEYFDNK